MAQGVFHHAANVDAQSFAALDSVVGIELDLHKISGFGIGGGRPLRLERGERSAGLLDDGLAILVAELAIMEIGFVIFPTSGGSAAVPCGV